MCLYPADFWKRKRRKKQQLLLMLTAWHESLILSYVLIFMCTYGVFLSCLRWYNFFLTRSPLEKCRALSDNFTESDLLIQITVSFVRSSFCALVFWFSLFSFLRVSSLSFCHIVVSGDFFLLHHISSVSLTLHSSPSDCRFTSNMQNSSLMRDYQEFPLIATVIFHHHSQHQSHDPLQIIRYQIRCKPALTQEGKQ